MVVDVQTGLMPLDEEVAERLRGVERPVILVANKADQAHHDVQAEEFHRLGRGHLLCVSTTQNRHRDELMQLIVDRLPEPDHETVELHEKTYTDPIQSNPSIYYMFTYMNEYLIQIHQ